MPLFIVTNLNDSGAGSLRQAILDANATTDADIITFASGITGGSTAGVDNGIITLSGGALDITTEITISGDTNGDQRADITISGNDASRVITATADLTLRSLDITDGNSGGSAGGAIYAYASTLTALHTTVRDSHTMTTGNGGGIYVLSGAVTLENTTLANSAGYYGGGLYLAQSTAILQNTTVSGNSASNNGGGISANQSDLTLRNSTVTLNMATDGGGVELYATTPNTLTIFNSILSGNLASGVGPDVLTAGGGGTITANHNLLGTTINPDIDQGGNISTDTPKLGVLADNGGSVHTHALFPGSAGFASGDATLLQPDVNDVDNDGDLVELLPIDANGGARAQGALDIGAVEAALVVDTLSDEDNGDFGAGDLSLREALGLATDGDVITFHADLTGGSTPGVNDGQITLAGTALEIAKTLRISGDVNGDGHADITLNGNATSRIFELTQTGTTSQLDSLTLIQGAAPTGGAGGAIEAIAGATLIIRDSTIRDSTASTGSGGALSGDGFYVVNSLITDNAAKYGGGIHLSGTTTSYVINATLSGNMASYGGGGIVTADSADLHISQSTITQNAYGGAGGALGSGITLRSSAQLAVYNSIVAQNGGLENEVARTGTSPATITGAANVLGTKITLDTDLGGNVYSNLPSLDALRDNGGPVQTHDLRADSPAIGTGDAAFLSADLFDADADSDITEPWVLDSNDSERLSNGSTLDAGAVQFSDDIAATSGTTGVIAIGDAVTGNIDYGFDQDWFSVFLTSGVTYRIDLQGVPTFAGTLPDPFLRGVYDPSAVLIPGSSDDDGGIGLNSQVTFSPATSGVHYIAAGAVTTGTGSYTLSLTDTTPIASVTLRDTFGTAVGTYFTIADAVAAATAGFAIEVDGTTYMGGIEDVLIGVDNLTVVLDSATAFTGTLDAAATLLSLSALGTGAVTFSGNAEPNILQGGDGADALIGLTGADTLIGGLGSDTLDGGGDLDTATYNASDARVEVNLIDSIADNGHATGDLLIDVENVIGSDFNDLLVGTNGANVLQGGDDVDNINGRGGDDLLVGGAGADLVSGANDNDTVMGGTGADTLRGNGGDDSVLGEAGTDFIFGGIGDDFIAAGSENDSVLGQGNADTILGDAGADTLRGGSGNDSIEGGSGNDSLFGNGNNDTLRGGEGDDSLQGNAGADHLFGDAGNDTLFSGISADRLDGGTGNDLLNGGPSDGVRDVFVFLVGYEQDRINQFDQAGTDRLELDESLWSATFPGLSAQDAVDLFGTLDVAGTVLTLDFGGGDVLEVQNSTGITQATFGADILLV